jgi:hypothetical protein
MPWRVRRELYLILFGAAAIVLGAIVIARDRSADLVLLGAVAVLAGAAIILDLLPLDGHDDQGER